MTLDKTEEFTYHCPSTLLSILGDTASVLWAIQICISHMFPDGEEMLTFMLCVWIPTWLFLLVPNTNLFKVNHEEKKTYKLERIGLQLFTLNLNSKLKTFF